MLRMKRTKVDTSDLENIIGEEGRVKRHDSNEYFTPHTNLKPSKVVKIAAPGVSKSTRSSSNNNNQDEDSGFNPGGFPYIPVRTGYRTLDMNIVEVMVNMECVYKLDQRQVAPCLAYIMNTLAGQRWELEREERNAESEGDTENIDDTEENNNVKRKRSKLKDLTFVLPSRKSLHQRLEDASLMSFKYIAESIQKTHGAGGTVTMGTDDTVKAG